ncbi:MAG: glutamate-cysteine ligase family protein [Polyangiaceae bacterium]
MSFFPSDPPPGERLTDFEQLLEPFRQVEKPKAQWKIGPESEKFGVQATSGAPLSYDGDHGVLRVLAALAESHGWNPARESDDGPIISLTREKASITLEPGAQLELSGAPAADIHEICAAQRGHLSELREISSEMNLSWLGVGFHPLASQDELPWVPKQRYKIMREYLPTRGHRALDMMRRTATVQANLDYSNERDAMRKLVVGLKLAPLLNAMTANSPFLEGRISGKKSLRGEVWLDMDPARSGLLPELCEKEEPTYADYAEWALDAGMFLFKRDGQVVANTGQTFRSFWQNGFQGHHATMADWRLHLNTLFPEARIKGTLEFRPCDSLPADLVCAVPALFTGLMYDEDTLTRAYAFAMPLSWTRAEREALIADGLAARLPNKDVRELALEVLQLAEQGLEHRARKNARGQDERVHLATLRKLVEAGRCPADRLLEGLSPGDPDLRVEILARTRV